VAARLALHVDTADGSVRVFDPFDDRVDLVISLAARRGECRRSNGDLLPVQLFIRHLPERLLDAGTGDGSQQPFMSHNDTAGTRFRYGARPIVLGAIHDAEWDHAGLLSLNS
jgi:hypothetical protein